MYALLNALSTETLAAMFVAATSGIATDEELWHFVDIADVILDILRHRNHY